MIVNAFVVFLLLCVDLLTKYFVSKLFTVDYNYIISPAFSINYVNTVVGYSLDTLLQTYVNIFLTPEVIHKLQFSISVFLVLILLAVLYHKALNDISIESVLSRVVCLFLISGTLGNMLNLWYCGYVVDFLRITTATDFVIIFNVADVYLYLALVVLSLTVLFLIIKSVIKKFNLD